MEFISFFAIRNRIFAQRTTGVEFTFTIEENHKKLMKTCFLLDLALYAWYNILLHKRCF